MELDDLKNNWKDITNQAQQQQGLNPATIKQMITNKYNKQMKRITYPEIIGMFVCLLGAAFILLKFGQLDTVFLKITGIASVLLLITLITISLLSLRHLKIEDINKPYAETLKIFASQKINFFKLQRLNITLSYLLLIATIILISKFFGGKNITGNSYFWTLSFTFGYIFLSFYARWVSRYYHKTLVQAEELLKDVDS